MVRILLPSDYLTYSYAQAILHPTGLCLEQILALLHSPGVVGMERALRFVGRLATVLFFLLVIVSLSGLTLERWVTTILGASKELGGDEHSAIITAVSLQVSLLAVFFLVASIALGLLGFFGYRNIEKATIAQAVETAEKAALEAVAKRSDPAHESSEQTERPADKQPETNPDGGIP